MEGDRFDTLIKGLSQSVGRRRLASGLLGGAFASLLTAEEGAARPAKPRRGRGHVSAAKHKAKAGCPKKAFKRCTTPAAKSFVAAIEACRTSCTADPQGADCQTCLDPHTADLARAAAACAATVCHGGPVAGAATTAPRTRRRVGAAANGGSCQHAQLVECDDRRERDLAICAALAAAACFGSGGAGCALAVAACLAQAGTGFADCIADFGCKTGGVCLPGDICCPHNTDTICNGNCCPSPQTCVDGACACADACGAGCPCKKGETCSNSQCCPTKLLLPGGVCCPEAERCGPTRTE
ncbi:MAG TPA: hypothetical protein VFU81_21960, partial [Thermomicrobiales bacterium]|nr:hypothetical protein [Thermomicrobiales bacterium]